MQISSSQHNVQLPVRSTALAPTEGVRRAQGAPSAVRSGEASAPRPSVQNPDESEESQSVRERLAVVAQAFSERLDHLAGKEGLSDDQKLALQEAHQSFLTNLQRLATQQSEGGQAERGLSGAFAAVKDALRGAVHEALRGAEPDVQRAGTVAERGADPAERLAAVQQKISDRLQNKLAQGNLSPRAAAALGQLAADFESHFNRLGEALAQGGFADTGKLGEAFAELMQQLRQDASAILGAGEPDSSALYDAEGARTDDQLPGNDVELLA